jgi:hypothetical protein
MDWKPVPHISRGLFADPELRPRPDYFDELIGYTRMLAKDFLHVRVDLMVTQGKIYFSELTLYNMGGFTVLEPLEWNETIGSLVDLEQSDRYLEVGRKRVEELEA